MKNKISKFLLFVFVAGLIGCGSNKAQTTTTLSINDSSYTPVQIDTVISVLKKRLLLHGIKNFTITKNNNAIFIQSITLSKEGIKDYLLKKGVLSFYEMYSIIDVAAGIQQADVMLSKKQNKIPSTYSSGPLLNIFFFASPYDDVNGVQQVPPEIGMVYKESLPQVKTYLEQSQSYLPGDIKFIFMPDENNMKGKIIYRVYALKNNTVKINIGNNISKAQSNFDNMGRPSIAVDFNAYGSNLFKRITAANINKYVAIVLDGEVVSAPRVISAIDGGRVEITGVFTIKEATDLAKILSTGYLPLDLALKSIEMHLPK
jgi:hypothetical protein